MPSTASTATGVVLLVSLLCAAPAAAIDKDLSTGRFDPLTKPRTGGTIGIRATPLTSLPAGDTLRVKWESAAGSRYRVWLDRRSGLPTLVEGRGEKWLDSGTGHSTADVGAVAERARQFVRDRVDLLGAPDEQWVLDRRVSGRRGADKWLVRFRQVVGGVPVEGAHFDFHVSRGRLVSYGARRWAPVRVPPEPVVDAAKARELLDGYVRPGPSDRLSDVAAPALLFVPLDADPERGPVWTGPRGEGLAHRLIWRFRFTDAAGIATWTGEIDAHSGEIVAFYDDTRYERIKGHVNPNTDTLWCGSGGCPEPDYPMPHADYTENGGPVEYANAFGLYECASPGATIETSLDGQFFRIDDRCGAISETTTCDAELDLGVADDVNCGAAADASPGNTDAARSAYYSLNLVRRKAEFWAPGTPWLGQQVECKTNVNATCNATWGNNTINMYRAGNGCGNTGMIQAVVVHEWGHGYDENDGGGFDNPSEAYADVVAIFEGRDSCVGPGFRVAQTCSGFGDTCLECTGVRDMDWDARRDHTPATPSGFVATYCPGGGGPCGEETHCASYVPSEAVYDLATRDLPAMGIDADTAWQLAERLWYQSRPGSGGDVFNCALPASDSCDVGSWYHQLRVQDDDDGDLQNGTPHASAIFAAFDRHDIACGDAGDPENQSTSACPVLEAPVVSFTAQTSGVVLDWTAVDGAAGYRVYRNENGCDRGQYPVVEVDASMTSYLDGGIANGFPLYYRLQAFGANAACESPVSECLEAAAQATAGRVRLDRESYGCDHPITVEVSDANHPSATMTVSVWSDTETTPEALVLTETSIGSARFSAVIPSTTAPPPRTVCCPSRTVTCCTSSTSIWTTARVGRTSRVRTTPPPSAVPRPSRS